MLNKKALAGTAGAPKEYVEDVFSTYLYTGTGSGTTININNGIDLSGKGGLVWIKARSAADSHKLYDTARGATKAIYSNLTNAEATDGTLDSFTSTGFVDKAGWGTTTTLASWTFRESSKFFDVVTYTGDGVAGRTVAHNLGSVPGMIIVKPISTTGNWLVYHRGVSSPQNKVLILNNTDPVDTTNTVWNGTAPTDTTFSVSDGSGWNNNTNGVQYVAYLFAHNAGGFGVSGNENVISCGSYLGNGSATGPSINLGYEPQFVLVKAATITQDWWLVDNMRGMPVGSGDATLSPNTSAAEAAYDWIAPTATGFNITSAGTSFNGLNETYIYMAIRRGPMATPTLGTSVYQPVIYTGNGATSRTVSTTITPDAAWFFHRNTNSGTYWYDRLRGNSRFIRTPLDSAESSFPSAAWGLDIQNAVYLNSSADYVNGSSNLNGLWAIKRAPGFFDTVCWRTGLTTTTQAHNLGVVPELIIYKCRSTAGDWIVYSASLPATQGLFLNTGDAAANAGAYWDNTRPTSTVFTSKDATLGSNANFVAYLFASVAGVSKVGSYTGTGATQTINCGFTTGARFVLIKRTDSGGDWFVWDSARGIIAGNDPYLLLNSGNAEVTNTDYVDVANSGFEISSTAPAAINANGGTYLFLAIA